MHNFSTFFWFNKQNLYNTEIVDLFSSYILKETETTARRGASKISENTLHRGGGEEGGVHFYSNVINDWYRGVAKKNKAHRAWEGGAILDLER